MHYALWVPLEIIMYGAVTIAARYNNQKPTYRLAAVLVILNCLPLWVFVASGSSDLAFDGLLYDVIITVTMTATLGLMGAGKKFSNLNWFGAVLAIAGFVLMKL